MRDVDVEQPTETLSKPVRSEDERCIAAGGTCEKDGSVMLFDAKSLVDSRGAMGRWYCVAAGHDLWVTLKGADEVPRTRVLPCETCGAPFEVKAGSVADRCPGCRGRANVQNRVYAPRAPVAERLRRKGVLRPKRKERYVYGAATR